MKIDIDFIPNRGIGKGLYGHKSLSWYHLNNLFCFGFFATDCVNFKYQVLGLLLYFTIKKHRYRLMRVVPQNSVKSVQNDLARH